MNFWSVSYPTFKFKNISLFECPRLVFDQREPPARCIQDKIILEISE